MTESFEVTFEGGPRDGETDVLESRLASTIGDGSDGGVYQRTDDVRDGNTVFRWRPLTNVEAQALLRGDIRANQP
jgi:hypothetical protein